MDWLFANMNGDVLRAFGRDYMYEIWIESDHVSLDVYVDPDTWSSLEGGDQVVFGSVDEAKAAAEQIEMRVS